MTGHGAPSALRSATASARLLGTEISRRLRPFLAARRGLDSIMPTSGVRMIEVKPRSAGIGAFKR